MAIDLFLGKKFQSSIVLSVITPSNYLQKTEQLTIDFGPSLPAMVRTPPLICRTRPSRAPFSCRSSKAELAEQRVLKANCGPVRSEPNLSVAESRRGRCKPEMIYVTPSVRRYDGPGVYVLRVLTRLSGVPSSHDSESSSASIEDKCLRY